MSLLDVALEYLRAGFSVVPALLVSDGNGRIQKRPLVAWDAYRERLPSESEWRLWDNNVRYNAIALVIGPATWKKWPYLWVLDVEAKNRKEAATWLSERLRGCRSVLGIADSISGGLHVYMLSDKPVRNGRCQWGDVLGDGHIVILPPSYVGERRYVWRKRMDSAVASPQADPNALALPGYQVGQNGDKAYVSALKGEPIPKGRRNVTLTSVAGVLWSSGLTEDELRSALHRLNQTLCDPPLSEREVEYIVRSITKRPRKREERVELPQVISLKDVPDVDLQPVMRFGSRNVYQSEIVVLHGPTGVGKTTAVIKAIPKGAVYISTEIPPYVAKRMAQIHRDGDCEIGYVMEYNPRKIAALIEQYPARVFVIDSYQHIAFDEAANGDWLVKQIKRVCNETGKVVIIVSHENRRNDVGLIRVDRWRSITELATKVVRLTADRRLWWEKDNMYGLMECEKPNGKPKRANGHDADAPVAQNGIERRVPNPNGPGSSPGGRTMLTDGASVCHTCERVHRTPPDVLRSGLLSRGRPDDLDQAWRCKACGMRHTSYVRDRCESCRPPAPPPPPDPDPDPEPGYLPETYEPVGNSDYVECAGCGRRIAPQMAVRSLADPARRMWHVNCAPVKVRGP